MSMEKPAVVFYLFTTVNSWSNRMCTVHWMSIQRAPFDGTISLKTYQEGKHNMQISALRATNIKAVTMKPATNRTKALVAIRLGPGVS